MMKSKSLYLICIAFYFFLINIATIRAQQLSVSATQKSDLLPTAWSPVWKIGDSWVMQGYLSSTGDDWGGPATWKYTVAKTTSINGKQYVVIEKTREDDFAESKLEMYYEQPSLRLSKSIYYDYYEGKFKETSVKEFYNALYDKDYPLDDHDSPSPVFPLRLEKDGGELTQAFRFPRHSYVEEYSQSVKPFSGKECRAFISASLPQHSGKEVRLESRKKMVPRQRE
ncbi:MAG: hypothetical protein WC969_06965 [Elusimicrobiota bacterium]